MVQVTVLHTEAATPECSSPRELSLANLNSPGAHLVGARLSGGAAVDTRDPGR